MIEYINVQLNQWGLWALNGRERLGYPKRAAFMRLVPGDGRSVTICDEEAMSINQAVQSLDAGLREVVDLYYIKMRSCDAATIAKALHCHRDTMYDRLHRAHLMVMDALHDQELLTGSDSLGKKQLLCGLLHPDQVKKARSS